MKKFGIIVMACVLVLGLSQCKKAEKPTADEGVFITLKASYGHRGERTDFIPSSGSFVWTNQQDEWVYVGGSDHYGCLGVLNGYGDGTNNINFFFGGTLYAHPNPGETLYFFYLGKGDERTGDNLTNLDFSNQDGILDNVTKYHIAIGEARYSPDIDVYTATLDMKMAIAYFDVNGFKNLSDEAETVSLHGEAVYSTAIVDYQHGSIVGNSKGNINLGVANEGKYVALIPSTTGNTTLEFDSDTKTGSIDFVHGIQQGKYYCNNGAALEVEASARPQ